MWPPHLQLERRRAVMNRSCCIVAAALPRCSIKFWGKVTGTTTDYIIVCGLTSLMETPQKKFYYA